MHGQDLLMGLSLRKISAIFHDDEEAERCARVRRFLDRSGSRIKKLEHVDALLNAGGLALAFCYPCNPLGGFFGYYAASASCSTGAVITLHEPRQIYFATLDARGKAIIEENVKPFGYDDTLKLNINHYWLDMGLFSIIFDPLYTDIRGTL